VHNSEAGLGGGVRVKDTLVYKTRPRVCWQQWYVVCRQFACSSDAVISLLCCFWCGVDRTTPTQQHLTRGDAEHCWGETVSKTPTSAFHADCVSVEVS